MTCASRLISIMLETYAGYVAIVGKPNAGKSTLLNAIMQQKLSIVTSKAQTTRHRIIAAHSEDNFQCIFLDTPGVLRPVARPVRPLSYSHQSAYFHHQPVGCCAAHCSGVAHNYPRCLCLHRTASKLLPNALMTGAHETTDGNPGRAD